MMCSGHHEQTPGIWNYCCASWNGIVQCMFTVIIICLKFNTWLNTAYESCAACIQSIDISNVYDSIRRVKFKECGAIETASLCRLICIRRYYIRDALAVLRYWLFSRRQVQLIDLANNRYDRRRHSAGGRRAYCRRWSLRGGGDGGSRQLAGVCLRDTTAGIS